MCLYSTKWTRQRCNYLFWNLVISKINEIKIIVDARDFKGSKSHEIEKYQPFSDGITQLEWHFWRFHFCASTSYIMSIDRAHIQHQYLCRPSFMLLIHFASSIDLFSSSVRLWASYIIERCIYGFNAFLPCGSSAGYMQ